MAHEGVSQRDCTSYYGFLEEEADRLSSLLEEFFAAEVCKKFPDPDCEFSSWAIFMVGSHFEYSEVNLCLCRLQFDGVHEDRPWHEQRRYRDFIPAVRHTRSNLLDTLVPCYPIQQAGLEATGVLRQLAAEKICEACADFLFS